MVPSQKMEESVRSPPVETHYSEPMHCGDLYRVTSYASLGSYKEVSGNKDVTQKSEAIRGLARDCQIFFHLASVFAGCNLVLCELW